MQSLEEIFFNVSKKCKVMLLHFSTMLVYEQLRLHFMIIEYQLNNFTEQNAFIIKLEMVDFP